MIYWIASYPRSGNTLVRILLKDVFGQGAFENDAFDPSLLPELYDLIGAKWAQMPWPEFLAWARSTSEPVFIKTHAIPTDGSPVIFVLRDGRLSFESYLRYHQDVLKNFDASLKRLIIGDDYYGCWSDFCERALAAPGQKLILRYEDLVERTGEWLNSIAEFAGLPRPQKKWVNPLAQLNKAIPSFFRSGQTRWRGETESWSKGDRVAFALLHGAMMDRLGYFSVGEREATLAEADSDFCDYLYLAHQQSLAKFRMQGDLEAKERVIKDLSRIQTAMDEKEEVIRNLESARIALAAHVGRLSEELGGKLAVISLPQAHAEATDTHSVQQLLDIEEKEGALPGLHQALSAHHGTQREAVQAMEENEAIIGRPELADKEEQHKSVEQAFERHANAVTEMLRGSAATIEIVRQAQQEVLVQTQRALTLLRGERSALHVLLRHAKQSGSPVRDAEFSALDDKKGLTGAHVDKLIDYFNAQADLHRALEDKERVIRELAEALDAHRAAHPALNFLALPISSCMRLPQRAVGAAKRLIKPKLGKLNQHPPIDLWIPPNYANTKAPANAPRISIVTPSLGQAAFIERTIRSVLDQQYPNLEYFVRDGGSTDGTVEILRRYESRLSGWESARDGGQSHAINLAFARTSGEIMAWLNSDDILLPGALAFVANYFERHPEVDVVYGHRILIDENDKQIGRWIMPAHDERVLSWADFIPQETLFWRRRAWEKIGGGLDESFRFAMDWDLLVRFRETEAKFARLPRLLGGFRIHTQQKTSAAISDIGFKEMARIRERTLGINPTHVEINRALVPYLMRHLVSDFVWQLRRG